MDVNNNVVTSITNSTLDLSTSTDSNCGVTGVFPFNNTQCLVAPGANLGSCPTIAGTPICTETADNVCTINRAQGVTGGTVLATYNGPLSQ